MNNLRVPNSDGIHLCSCENAIITDSFFTCGDDCVAISGITNWDKPCENIIVSNCIMQTRSAAVRMGHLDSKVKNVIASNLTILNSNRGIAIFANGKTGMSNQSQFQMLSSQQKYLLVHGGERVNQLSLLPLKKVILSKISLFPM